MKLKIQSNNIDDIFSTSISTIADSNTDNKSDDFLEKAFIIKKLDFNLEAEELKILLSKLNLLLVSKHTARYNAYHVIEPNASHHGTNLITNGLSSCTSGV